MEASWWLLQNVKSTSKPNFYKFSGYRYSRKALWDIARVLYLRKRLVLWSIVCRSLPGNNSIFCKNEGCSRIGSPDEALQLDKKRVPLLRSVTGEHHVINQAWEIKSRALQPPEP
jgi:hypothetical protein